MLQPIQRFVTVVTGNHLLKSGGVAHLQERQIAALRMLFGALTGYSSMPIAHTAHIALLCLTTAAMQLSW